MIKRFFFVSMMALALSFVVACKPEQSETKLIEFEQAPLKIVKITGEEIDFDVEIADTPQKRERGLMFRENLDDNKGMIFVFEESRPVAFWMKNTLIPLDMVFIKQDGTIIYVHQMAQPHDETPIGSEIPVKALLELRGGLTQDLGIHIGDTIVFKGL